MTIYTTKSKGRGQPGSPEASSLKPEAPRLAPRASPRSRQAGFALIITITLLAFLLLVMVGLATFTKVETSVSDNALKQTQARQNALMALNIAIGQLQKHAGPDARVTATAKLLDTSAVNENWIGVWDATNTSAAPLTWLVSGVAPAPGAKLAGSNAATRLLRAGDKTGIDTWSKEVWVPIQRILTEGLPGRAAPITTGVFGYYVSDESLKAQLRPVPIVTTAASLPTGYYATSQIARDRTLQMGRRSPVGFADIAAYDPYSTVSQAGLPKVFGRQQQVFLDPTNIAAASVTRHWHDYTALSRGVLADTSTGRLKTDLTLNGAALGNVFTKYTALATAVRASTRTPTYPITPYSENNGIGFVIAPIITQFVFQASIHNGPGDGAIGPRVSSRALEVRARFWIELWNPYSAALDATQLRVIVKKLPVVTVAGFHPQATIVDYGSAAVDLMAAYSNSPDGITLTLPFTDANWPAGRVYGWSLPSGYNTNGAVKSVMSVDQTFRNTYWPAVPNISLNGSTIPDATMQFRFSAQAFAVELDLQASISGTWTSLATYKMPTFQALSNNGTLASTDRTPDFGMIVRFLDRSDYLSTLGDINSRSTWLTTALDPRAATYTGERFTPTIDDEPASYTADAPTASSAKETVTFFNRDPAPSVSSSNYEPTYNYDVPMFELPRQEYISVGSLQHLLTPGGRVYALGNSWGNAINDRFDHYFFSTFPTDTPDTTTTNRFANQHLLRMPPVSAAASGTDGAVRAAPVAEVAGRFMVDGAFNFNSTSAAAWEAVLRGLKLNSWTYVVPDVNTSQPSTTATTNLDSAFFHYAQSAEQVWRTAGVKESNNQATARYYRRGARSLSSAQVSALATNIATAIQQQRSGKGPFRTVKEFLAPIAALSGRNIFEDAIRTTDAAIGDVSLKINGDNASGVFATAREIDDNAPAALTSGDIMTAIAPFTGVRGDTFVIRVYGALMDPLSATAADPAGALGTPQAEAWLEATVQRCPDTVSATDSIAAPDPAGLGRKIRIISLRWLTKDDL